MCASKADKSCHRQPSIGALHLRDIFFCIESQRDAIHLISSAVSSWYGFEKAQHFEKQQSKQLMFHNKERPEKRKTFLLLPPLRLQLAAYCVSNPENFPAELTMQDTKGKLILIVTRSWQFIDKVGEL